MAFCFVAGDRELYPILYLFIIPWSLKSAREQEVALHNSQRIVSGRVKTHFAFAAAITSLWAAQHTVTAYSCSDCPRSRCRGLFLRANPEIAIGQKSCLRFSAWKHFPVLLTLTFRSQLEMILQAQEYEASQGKRLDDFFTATAGKAHITQLA